MWQAMVPATATVAERQLIFREGAEKCYCRHNPMEIKRGIGRCRQVVVQELKR